MFKIPADPIVFVRIRLAAGAVADDAHAAYWAPSSREHLAGNIDRNFRELASQLGYRVELIAPDAEAEEAA